MKFLIVFFITQSLILSPIAQAEEQSWFSSPPPSEYTMDQLKVLRNQQLDVALELMKILPLKKERDRLEAKRVAILAPRTWMQRDRMGETDPAYKEISEQMNRIDAEIAVLVRPIVRDLIQVSRVIGNSHAGWKIFKTTAAQLGLLALIWVAFNSIIGDPKASGATAAETKNILENKVLWMTLAASVGNTLIMTRLLDKIRATPTAERAKNTENAVWFLNEVRTVMVTLFRAQGVKVPRELRDPLTAETAGPWIFSLLRAKREHLVAEPNRCAEILMGLTQKAN